jgi:hypothetical protein
MYLEQTYETNKTIDLNLNYMKNHRMNLYEIVTRLLWCSVQIFTFFNLTLAAAEVEQHGRR